jgi:DNA-binding response OmpR family regulator
MRILLVEDEPDLAQAIATGLRAAGFAVDVALTGGDALTRSEVNSYDAVVLDRALPDVSGDDVCRHLVAMAEAPRVIMVTAAGNVDQRVDGLRIGADDYMAKPFEMRELVARLQALARRPPTVISPVLEWNGVVLDPNRHVASRDGEELALSRKEFSVLEHLMRARGSVVSSEELLEKVWDEEIDPFTNIVRVTMMNLRRKLGLPSAIETVTGVGYRLVDPA